MRRRTTRAGVVTLLRADTEELGACSRTILSVQCEINAFNVLSRLLLRVLRVLSL